MKHWMRILALMLVSLGLGVSSDVLWLGIMAFAAFAFVGFANFSYRKDALRRPVYRKLFAYGMIVPCAIWWVLTPSVEYGVSAYLVYIPGWYLLFLAFLQLRSLGRGGFEAFVVFDGLAALLASVYMAPRFVVAFAVVALLLIVASCLRRDVPVWKFVLFVVLFGMFAALSAVGFRYWKDHRRAYVGKMAEDYYLKNRVMGFDPVASLGSFRSNYESRYNKEIVLRVWDTLAPRYIKAATYEKYVGGLWKLPTSGFVKLHPSRYQVDYAVFETKDSLASASRIGRGLRKVWVQSTVDNFGFLFAANDAVGVAVKNVDSLDYYYSGIFSAASGNRPDWYYFVQDSAAEPVADFSDETIAHDLFVSEKYTAFLDSISAAMNIADSVWNVEEVALEIVSYFKKNFKYSLVVPGYERGLLTGVTNGEDPLRAFWKSKMGYCEYYATLATLLLRSRGIPARYVTGFVGGVREEGLPYVAYRRYNAHAWVEVFADGRWMQFDPTPPAFMVPGMKPSWLSRRVEYIQGRLARLLHVLRDGEWRNVVEDWQQVSDRLVRNPYMYFVLLLLLFVFVVLKRKKRTSENLSESAKHAAHVAYWSKKLVATERKLSRYGFVRKNSETVGCFVKRLEEKEKIASLVTVLREYENNRWNG